MISGLSSFLLYALAFLSVLTVVVFVHELGHFLVARWCGVKVQAFSIGFGPEIGGFVDRHGTRWRLAWIPLGGYVKFMDDDNPTSTHSSSAAKTMTEEERAGAFHTKPLWQRAAVVAAGPLANFLLAITIFAIGFMLFGLRTTAPRVDEVAAGTPAAIAGFEIGDVVRSIDGRAITSFSELQRTVATSGGRELVIVVERKNRDVEIKVAPRLDEFKDSYGEQQRAWRLGIRQTATPETVREESVNPIRAVALGVKETSFIVTSTLGYLGQSVVRAYTQGERPKEIGGPFRIADVAGKVAKRSVFDLIYLAAFISVSVGLVNLFPIPLLDGGHLVFYAIEAVRGRPLSDRSQEISFRIGLAVVLTLMLFSFWNDIEVIQRWLT